MEDSNTYEMDELFEMFHKNQDMFYLDIPPGFDFSKQTLELRSNAGSREDIIKFFESNAKGIFGSDSVKFDSSEAKKIIATIVQNDCPIISVSFDIENCNINDACTYLITPTKIMGD